MNTWLSAWVGPGTGSHSPRGCQRASCERASRGRSALGRRREPSGGSRSRAACGRPSVSRSSPCWLSAARQPVRLCPRAQQPPTGAHAALPRCSRELPAPLAQPPERRRRDGWPSPPRRDRSRDRRARCPVRESPACGRTRRSWRARRIVTRPSASRAGVPTRACSRAPSIVSATRWLVRAQHAAAVLSAPAVSSIEASSWACLSCDGPAPSAAPGHAAAARAYRCEMLSWRSPGGMRACAAAMAASTKSVQRLLDALESGREEGGARSIAGALLETLGSREQRERVVREPDAGIVHDTQPRGARPRHPWGRDCKVPRSGHPPRRRRRHGKLDPCARG